MTVFVRGAEGEKSSAFFGSFDSYSSLSVFFLYNYLFWILSFYVCNFFSFYVCIRGLRTIIFLLHFPASSLSRFSFRCPRAPLVYISFFLSIFFLLKVSPLYFYSFSLSSTLVYLCFFSIIFFGLFIFFVHFFLLTSVLIFSFLIQIPK